MKHGAFCSLAMFPKITDSRFDMDYFLNTPVPLVESLFKKAGLVDFRRKSPCSL